ncbi:hypothetical protein PXK58_20025 [Phaeobacter gallaeciensis]|uniref:hypothetical protein n=1 Tax=Phaeobacter gallaeciensis TaxID=60890 RepID=UPI0023806BA9|nr:hypothetical protein [Phaeobacter gallaeciensis]MDE4276606.1 hypothetical protein [Phaeobacter gallaeciensis]MDE4301836.1 hypothetical protein [Phaeobacter gallaeciensis]MDE5187004.1 hypothetical protein [Phaeobacter gallaeciensis]
MLTKKALLTINVNTFIRYYSIDPSKLVGEVSRRMQQPGGYDYYRLLSDAIKAKIENASDDEIQLILSGSSNPSEVSYNRSAYEVFVSKFGKKKNISIFEKKGQVKLLDGELVIVASPAFSHQTANEFSVYNIWAAQNPPLDRARAAVGVYLLQQAFKKSVPNYQYKVFDAVTGKTYGAVNNATAQAVGQVAKTIIDIAKSC